MNDETFQKYYKAFEAYWQNRDKTDIQYETKYDAALNTFIYAFQLGYNQAKKEKHESLSQ
jgi:hypothetical protein